MALFRYDFISVPLAHPRFGREHVEGKAKERPGAFTRSDLLLSSSGQQCVAHLGLQYLLYIYKVDAKLKEGSPCLKHVYVQKSVYTFDSLKQKILLFSCLEN